MAAMAARLLTLQSCTRGLPHDLSSASVEGTDLGRRGGGADLVVTSRAAPPPGRTGRDRRS